MNDLVQDQKKFRKLRKILRQIEHLNLLQRVLNQEEKAKISKRPLLREQLKQLFEKYPNGELLAYDSRDNTFETEESLNLSQTASPFKENDMQQLSERFNEVKLEEKNSEIEPNIVQETQQVLNEPNEATKVAIIEPLNQSEDRVLDKKESLPKDSLTKDQVKSLKKTPVVKAKKLDVTFDTITVPEAHQDLVTCIDIDGKNGLVATGSRDTSINIWKYNEKQKSCESLKTFGQHSSIVSQVKFFNSNDYKMILENLKLNSEENEDLIDSLIELSDDLPLVISSSLDCSLRLWSVSLLKCIKEFYLYNPIKSFDTKNSFLIVGQDAGKIQLWKDWKLIKTIRTFNDTDNVVDIKFMGENQIYALSQNGFFKTFNYSDKDLEELNSIDILDRVRENNGDMARNFRQFEALNMNHLIFLNDNQSFIIEYDLESNNSSLTPTNTNSYAFSSCFFKHPNSNLVFISSFDIDNAESKINVFKNSIKLDYAYSLEDLDQDLSISAMSSCDVPFKESCMCVSIGAGTTLKIFILNNSDDVLMPLRPNKAKILKMMRKFEIKNHSLIDSNDESDKEQSDDENETQNQIKTEDKKSTCSIQ